MTTATLIPPRLDLRTEVPRTSPLAPPHMTQHWSIYNLGEAPTPDAVDAALSAPEMGSDAVVMQAMIMRAGPNQTTVYTTLVVSPNTDDARRILAEDNLGDHTYII